MNGRKRIVIQILEVNLFSLNIWRWYYTKREMSCRATQPSYLEANSLVLVENAAQYNTIEKKNKKKKKMIIMAWRA